MEFHETAKKVARIEFYLATIIYVIFFFALVEDRESLSEWDYLGAPEIISFGSPLLRELVQATSIYGAFIFLTLYSIPRLLRREAIALNVIWVILTTIAVGVVFGSLDQGFAPLAVFLFYSAIKHGFIYTWIQRDVIQSRFRFLAPGVMVISLLWLISVVLFITSGADEDIMAAWITMIPFGILLYSISFFTLLPAALKKRRALWSYVWRVILIILVASVPIGILTILMTENGDAAMSIVLLNAFFQLIVTTPASWILYRRYKSGAEEIAALQQELGQSTASIDFLRSQINPHFLFNAMNTLYGTAIQEDASRTAEAIQKLGDMMRFMLQENMQPKILLVREVEYLRNYISLQRLRTDTIPGVTIETHIDDQITLAHIPPMLLIPFVENAFKHGISFREPSYIRISLNIASGKLHFDVSNSCHPRPANDPEKDKSGIGLPNVKQRLQLLYPGRHELIIRETGREFFVHLSLELGKA